jgi:hypothetical protein
LYTNAEFPLPAIEMLLLDPAVGVTVPMDEALQAPIGSWPPPVGTRVLLEQKLMAPVDWLTAIMPNAVWFSQLQNRLTPLRAAYQKLTVTY